MISSLPQALSRRLIAAAESGAIPDSLVRYGIRGIVKKRREDELSIGRTAREFASDLSRQPIKNGTVSSICSAFKKTCPINNNKIRVSKITRLTH